MSDIRENVLSFEDNFVPYELANKLKANGFDESCFAFFRSDMDGSEQLHSVNFDGIGSNNSDNALGVSCTAPTYQQTIDWLRIVKNIDVTILPVFRDKCGYDSFKRDGYTFEIMQIEPCQYLDYTSFNVCAEDRDEEKKEYPDDPPCYKPSFKDYNECRIKAIESALTLIQDK